MTSTKSEKSRQLKQEISAYIVVGLTFFTILSLTIGDKARFYLSL